MPLALLLLPMLARTSQFSRSAVPSFGNTLSVTAATRPLASQVINRVHAQILRAKRLLAAQPEQPLNFVTIAAEDPVTMQIHLLTLPKETFLKEGAEVTLDSTLGTPLTVHVVRPNYVNTAVEVRDASGRALSPLAVKYPVERKGALSETAYYTSAHPALESPDVAQAGQAYVHDMLEIAAKDLAGKGYSIDPSVIDVAEHLCIVEHTDHKRFTTENQKALFDEIDTLYALNEGGTYGYSVSSAGAGGMIQMIPSTYLMIRERHPGVGLNPDFVAGMRDHTNALEAMLLYMQETWNGLVRQNEVKRALDSQEATQAELLAAGYNSNPARLALYLKRGGSGWRSLIPRETQMYLQIYASVDQQVSVKEHTT